MADSASRSEAFGPFRTLAARLDDLDQRVLGAGAPTPEQIAEAVGEYLLANPVAQVEEVVGVALVLSPPSIFGLGGDYDPGVSFEVELLSGFILAGAKVLVWSGGPVPQADGGMGLYTADGNGVFVFDAEQPLDGAGVLDYATTLWVGADVSHYGATGQRLSTYTIALAENYQGAGPTYIPVGGAAAAWMNRDVVIANLTIATDLTGVADLNGPNPTPSGMVVATIGQSDPLNNSVFLGQTVDPGGDPSDFLPLIRISNLPTSGIIVTDALARDLSELGPGGVSGGWILAFPLGEFGSPTDDVVGWRVIKSPVDNGSVAWDDVSDKPTTFAPDTVVVSRYTTSDIDINAPITSSDVLPVSASGPVSGNLLVRGNDPIENGVYDVDGSGNLTPAAVQPRNGSVVVLSAQGSEVFVTAGDVFAGGAEFNRVGDRSFALRKVEAILVGPVAVDGSLSGAVQGWTPADFQTVFIVDNGPDSGFFYTGVHTQPWIRDSSGIDADTGTERVTAVYTTNNQPLALRLFDATAFGHLNPFIAGASDADVTAAVDAKWAGRRSINVGSVILSATSLSFDPTVGADPATLGCDPSVLPVLVQYDGFTPNQGLWIPTAVGPWTRYPGSYDVIDYYPHPTHPGIDGLGTGYNQLVPDVFTLLPSGAWSQGRQRSVGGLWLPLHRTYLFTGDGVEDTVTQPWWADLRRCNITVSRVVAGEARQVVDWYIPSADAGTIVFDAPPALGENIYIAISGDAVQDLTSI